MTLELYYAPFSCALVPYVALTEAGAAFEVKPLNIRGKANMTPEYLALNPKHKVPLLLVDSQPLSENVAIQMWIHQAFPDAKLLPSDPWDHAQAVSLLSWFSSGVHPHISRYNAPAKFCRAEGSAESIRELAGQMLVEAFVLADRMLQSRRYLLQDFSLADVYLFWCFRRAGFLKDLDLSSLGAIAEHFDRLNGRPSIRKAIEYDEGLREHFGLTP